MLWRLRSQRVIIIIINWSNFRFRQGVEYTLVQDKPLTQDYKIWHPETRNVALS